MWKPCPTQRQNHEICKQTDVHYFCTAAQTGWFLNCGTNRVFFNLPQLHNKDTKHSNSTHYGRGCWTQKYRGSFFPNHPVINSSSIDTFRWSQQIWLLFSKISPHLYVCENASSDTNRVVCLLESFDTQCNKAWVSFRNKTNIFIIIINF